MNYIHVAYFLCLGLHPVFCAPAPEKVKTFYDAIVEKCPSVHSLATFENQPIFKTCKDWKVISEVDKLTGTNRKEILCLLYFESFTQYCTNTQTPNINAPKNVLSVSVDAFCDYAKTIPNKNLKTIFTTGDDCKKICSDEMGDLVSVCGTSYNFAHVTPVPETRGSDKQPQEVKSEGGNQNEPVPKPENSEKNKPEKKEQTSETVLKPKPSGEGSAKTKAVAVFSQKAANPDESKANPSQDLQNPAVPAVGEIIPVNQEPPVPDSGTKPAEGVEVQSKEQKNVNDVKNDANLVQAEAKPLAADKSLKAVDGGIAEHVKPDAKAVNAADVKDQTKKVESNPTLQEPPETDNQEIPLDLDQDKGDQNQVANPESEMEEAQPPDGQDEENPEANADANGAPVDKSSKPQKVEVSEPASYATEMEGDSYFFTYFMLLCIIFIVGYVCYHNKQKILALILEGRKGKRQFRGRRPNSANYHKLDSNLEEAITSSCTKNPTNVIY